MRTLVVILLSFAAHFCFAQTNLLPVEYFGGLPDVAKIKLSPDGYKVASFIRVDVEDKKGSAVQVVDLKTGDKKIVLFTDNKMFDLNWMRWKGNSNLLVGINFAEKRADATSFRKFKVRETRLLVVNVDSNTYHEAFNKSFLLQFKNPPASQDDVTDMLEDDSNNIYMNYGGTIFQVNINDQSTKRIYPYQSRPFTGDWMTDRQHNIRIGFTDEDNVNHIKLRDPKNNSWRELWSYKEFSSDEIVPLGFGLDTNILYINAYLNGRLAIFKVDLNTKDLKRELIAADSTHDVEGHLIYSNITHDVIGISDKNSNKIFIFDQGYGKLTSGINKVLPKTSNWIVGMSDDEKRYLLFSSSDVESGVYYIGDRNAKTLDVVAHRYKNLQSNLMVEKKLYKYKARDGLEIESYLSLPQIKEAKKLPAIILPHGGPISNDDESFDYWAQFFANRGYAVLQMNYRGSSGRGLDFRNSGLKNWGLQMQDDIEDGARSLIKDGIVDADSLAIVGASYGGYAALEGVVKTPNFYKCAVSVAGVSNVKEFVYDHRVGWSNYNFIDQQIGNDSEHLEEISPSYQAEKIKVPVLLIHGDSDRQVDPKHSREMFNALNKFKKNVKYIELPNEDHYLANNENRIATFKAIDEFLAKYLPVKH